jgi:predicted phage tail protein
MTADIRTPIVGHGGGKSGSGGGSQAPDSLRSRAVARVIDLLSEGEIEGLVDGAKSIYLNGTPLQNEDDSFNFNGLTVAFRHGTQSQTYIPGFPDVENEIAVGTQVMHSAALIRTINDPTVNAVRVTVSTPSLYAADNDGNIAGSRIDYNLYVQTQGGGYVLKIQDAIRGKTTSKYQTAHRIELHGAPPWDIKVERVTADNTDIKVSNDLYWDSYTEIVDGKFRYPNSAICAMQIDSSQFSSIPARAFNVRGLKIRVPTNYDPATRTYTGLWDGTFKIAWTDNPAWCYYDILVTDRYGLGRYLSVDQVNKWALYSIGRYCDELVPDGIGGMEPRFTCFLYMQNRQEAYVWLQQMASIFRCMQFWGAGAITCAQDAPTDATALFVPANVTSGIFTYSGVSSKARHTVALVSWNDPKQFFAQVVEPVSDKDGIERYGVIETEVIAIGCKSQGQARRLGKWILYTEKYESETVTFSIGLDGSIARPGQVIKIADPARTGARLGGRLLDAGLSSVRLDAPVTLAAGVTYTLSIIGQDAAIIERVVSSPAGETAELQVAVPFDSAPRPTSIWVLGSDDAEPQTFRVVAVTEPKNGQFQVTGVAHYPGKYDLVEQDLQLQPQNYSLLNQMLNPPAGLTISSAPRDSGGATTLELIVSWHRVDMSQGYAVSYQVDNNNLINLPVTTGTSIDIPNARAGTYVVYVRTVNVYGIQGPAATITAALTNQGLLRVQGLTEPGSGVTIGDQRNLLPVAVGSLRSQWIGITLSYTSADGSPPTATISISAATLQIGDTSISYNASSVSLTGTSSSTVTYYLYYRDPGFQGGSCTLNASTTGSDLTAFNDAIYVGSIDVTYPASGGGAGGGSGHAGGGACVSDASHLPLGTARDLDIGVPIACASNDLAEETATVRRLFRAPQACVRVSTLSGISLTCSVDAPLLQPGGECVPAAEALDCIVAVRTGDAPAWELVTDVAPVGIVAIVGVDAGDRCFWAGDQPGRYILHHNKVIP